MTRLSVAGSPIWSCAVFGPYRLLHGDAKPVLSRLREAAGHAAEASSVAREALELAWRDGWEYTHFQSRAAGSSTATWKRRLR